jgi:hypothetical protein
MMASDVSHRRDAMDQSGEYHPAYIFLLAVCGSIGGYLWYLAMRWVFQRLHLLNGHHGSETP